MLCSRARGQPVFALSCFSIVDVVLDVSGGCIVRPFSKGRSLPHWDASGQLVSTPYRGSLSCVARQGLGDVVFGLVHLLDKQYRPAPADLPDERLWRSDPAADYGALNTAARGRPDLDRAARHWPEMLRVVGSIHTGEVRAFDVMRILQRNGSPTPLGDAFAHYGRVFKSRHLLSYFDDEGYRRDIKGIRNLQEGRHSLAKYLFHGKLGKIYKAYQAGMEEQLGALGLVLNCVTLWNTRYMDAALQALRAQGYPVLDADVGRLSAFGYKHINVHGSYTFSAVELPGGLRMLRDPDAVDEDDD